MTGIKPAAAGASGGKLETACKYPTIAAGKYTAIRIIPPHFSFNQAIIVPTKRIIIGTEAYIAPLLGANDPVSS